MGTPAIITFIESDGEEYSVYQHWDGYPENVIPAILNIERRWPWPRWEADEAAAAYVATYKVGAGDIRLCNSKVGADFHYTVNFVPDRRNPCLRINCFDQEGKLVSKDCLVPNGEPEFQEA